MMRPAASMTRSIGAVAGVRGWKSAFRSMPALYSMR
jgi:hypothetical protein